MLNSKRAHLYCGGSLKSQKLVVAQLVTKYPPLWNPYLAVIGNEFCPEPDEFVHILTQYSFKIQLNIILLSAPSFPIQLLPSRFSYENFASIYRVLMRDTSCTVSYSLLSWPFNT